jgi:hypothetical protein
VFTLLGSACAGNRAYLDWRPGLTEMNFEGLFELSMAEFDGYSTDAEANRSFDRHHGQASPDASAAMAEVGATLVQADQDQRGYAILELGGDGNVSMLGDHGNRYDGAVDWFAITPDHKSAALLSGTKLGVVIDGASTGIDIASLVGGSLGGYQVMMIVHDGELTVFTLPELGGVVTADEPGFVFSFRRRADAREPWDVSVARVAIKI